MSIIALPLWEGLIKAISRRNYKACQIKSRDLVDTYKIRASCLATGNKNVTQLSKNQLGNNRTLKIDPIIECSKEN